MNIRATWYLKYGPLTASISVARAARERSPASIAALLSPASTSARPNSSWLCASSGSCLTVFPYSVAEIRPNDLAWATSFIEPIGRADLQRPHPAIVVKILRLELHHARAEVLGKDPHHFLVGREPYNHGFGVDSFECRPDDAPRARDLPAKQRPHFALDDREIRRRER